MYRTLGGKNVRIKCPGNSGSTFFNHKRYFSIVLQALAHDHYRFTTVDIGAYGKRSDVGSFHRSALGII